MSRRTWKPRIEWIVLGVAVLLAADPSPLVVPARAAAAPARATASAAMTEVAQVEPDNPPDPGTLDPGNQNSGDQNPGDDSGEDDSDQIPTDQTDQPVGKAYPVEPDSLLKAKTTPPPAGGAPMDTLRATAPGTAPARRPISGASAPRRRTILGLHPAFFVAGILALHIFVVKAVNE
jgi:hypothetical protein